MTDDHLDRLIRDVDPYRPEIIKRLAGADEQLLEEIMSTPKPDSVPARPLRRTLVRRLAGPAAAAAAVAGIVVASSVWSTPPDDRYAGPTGLPGVGTAAISGRELDLKAAQQHPRLLIDEPGWNATSVYGFAEESGTIEFRNGDRSLEMNWYPDEQYQDYYDDRLHVSRPEATTVADRPASVFTYSENDMSAMREPQDGTFVEVRTGGNWTRATFDGILTHVIKVDAESFLDALPPEIVTPGDVREEAARILADLPSPPGFDVSVLDNAGANDPYQFGAAVAGRVTCDWIAEWIRADSAGDTQAVEQAAAALRSSHRWKVLHDMNDEGDYPEVVWEIADQVADGDVPRSYQESLGC
ncbi:hypothetical protein O3597_07720 [Verrucosispora sp. WMMA2044]|uniref:hypothetical protein n=1 Tax=Verrucosispora sp. WMMA2044 TaxID=3016419 RepID=UPI00248D0629|nr:hypothetical protein [Verrucosispora sp. WMMA2044]WBB50336.1 hypothetical protein O3597_07720 [Verrucosispora sp. WMMA2044]